MDKATLKSRLKELFKENPEVFKEIVEEILHENQSVTPKNQENRRRKIEKMINDDFDQFEDTFKALA